jgi:hypothetical protein
MSQIPVVLPDTNYLLDYSPYIHETKWLLNSVEILISEVVISELVGLCNNEYPLLARNANQALNVIRVLQKEADQGRNSYQQGKVIISFAPRPKQVAPPLESQTPDHQIIATARALLTRNPPRFCAILTSDRELCHIAEAMSVIAVMPAGHNDQTRFLEEIQRKFEWWVKTRSHEPQPLVKMVRTQLNGEGRFLRRITRLYSQVRAARHRTLLSLAPLTTRVALTAHIILHVPNPERRVVLVTVESAAAADYWAAEIRRRGGFKEGDIQVFGMDNLGRLERARAVIYRYDQLARRLPKHIDRLKQEQQRLTAVVDGCDMLDPADLAPLLFDCDQFIGLNHNPAGTIRSAVNRMLDAYIRDRAKQTYSFADAERDGWGQPYDFFHHPVTFTPDEQEIWTALNNNYLRQREKVVQYYSQLKNADNFWEGLGRVLADSVAPEAAQLFPLREEREQMVHQAANKLTLVKRLVSDPTQKANRRLILDYDHLWTPVLQNQLTEMGMLVGELAPGDAQQTIWKKFNEKKLNTLLLSTKPQLILPNTHFHQLIILSPLRPLPEISTIVDWTLSHTFTKDALRIDLLYVADSPEEVAMLKVAESCFNLRYGGL